MSTKNCCKNHIHKPRKRIIVIIVGTPIILTIILVAAVFTIRATLRPCNPSFILQEATIYAFNVSTQLNLLTSNFLVTLSTQNPNYKFSVYYDKLDVYATCYNQKITLCTQIAPTCQGHNEINVWSASIYGMEVPVAPYNVIALSQDLQAAGSVLLMIKIDGRVRFKAGIFNYGSYHLSVKCPAYIQIGSNTSGIVVGDNANKFQLVQSCTVSVWK